MADVGMNLAPVLYYGAQFPFLDRMKMASGWSASGATVPLDDSGNPLAIPTGASLISTIIPLDPVSAAPTDVYELTYSGGAATFQIVGANILSTAPGKVVFQYTSTTTTMASLIVRSMSATDPIHDLHVVRQDEVAAFNQGELFNSEFLDQVSHWQTLRFMDWVGNAPHGVVLPYNYQSSGQWGGYFRDAALSIARFDTAIPLYPFPFSLLFGRKLHFIAELKPSPQ